GKMKTVKETIKHHNPPKEIVKLISKHMPDNETVLDSFKEDFNDTYFLYMITNDRVGSFAYPKPKFPQWWHGAPNDPIASVLRWSETASVKYSNHYRKFIIVPKNRQTYL